MAYDSGWNDPRVLLEVGGTPYEQLIVFNEFYRHEPHVDDVLGCLETNGKPEGRIYVEYEPAELNTLRRAGHTVKKAEKSTDAGIAEVRKRLRADGNVPASRQIRALT